MVTVKEIHDSFYEEARTTNIYARKYRYDIEEVTPALEVPSNIKKLVAKGFGNSKPVVDSYSKVKEAKGKIKSMIRENPNAEFLAKYAISYPSSKIITRGQLVKLCNKYGLIFGDTGNYIDDIPEKNLTTILNFKVKDEDRGKREVFDEAAYRQAKWDVERSSAMFEFTDFDDWDARLRGRSGIRQPRRMSVPQIDPKAFIKIEAYDHYLIAAAPHMFNMEGKLMDGVEITDDNSELIKKIDSEVAAQVQAMVNDPIVLAPLDYNMDAGKEHQLFAIVTAWGEEASDPELNTLNN